MNVRAKTQTENSWISLLNITDEERDTDVACMNAEGSINFSNFLPDSLLAYLSRYFTYLLHTFIRFLGYGPEANLLDEFPLHRINSAAPF